MSCNSCIGEFDYSPEEIRKVSESGGLLSMELECSLRCNFRCRYCYAPSSLSSQDELKPEEMRDVILQARDLGARKIIVLGGEPMIYPGIMELLEFITTHGMTAEIFTNGSRIDADAARELARMKVRMVLKMNSFDSEVQDYLAGKAGAYEVIQTAFRNLKQAGYPSSEQFMAVSSVICPHNLEELPRLWEWLREQDIEPYFEMITPQGRAHGSSEWALPPPQMRELFEEIAEIDREKFGREWTPQPPLMGNKCLRHQYSCLVNSLGQVLPCVGVTLSVGNIREKRLSTIIEDSEVIRNLRNYGERIKGPCSRCDSASQCYGCRGSAYQLTGDYMASDPLCWNNDGCLDEIIHLPAGIDEIIPQRSPMRLVEDLVSMAEGGGECRLRVRPELHGMFIDRDGYLDETAFFEIIAQTTAAYEGFHTNRFDDKRIRGLLLGARKLKISGRARSGDLLRVRMRKQIQFNGFSIVRGEVSCEDRLLAEGEIKLWHE